MDKQRLLIPVRCTTRKFYLQPPPPGRHGWYFKFTPPRHAESSLSRVYRATGTDNLAAAKRVAAQAIESFWLDQGKAAEALKLRSDLATIGELIERYKERANQRPVTVRSNVSSLRLVIRTVHGGNPDDRLTNALSPSLIQTFEKKRMEGAAAIDFQSIRTSTASYVRQARSLVAPKKMKFYEGMKLPPLEQFRIESVEAPSRPMPRPPDMNALAAMEAAVPQLAREDPAAYLAHLMFAHWGLRNIEIVNARAHWIVAGRLGIIERPEENFYPKGCEGWIEVAADVVTEILRYQHLCADGFLIPGRTMTERRDAVYRRHSKWVSTWLRGRSKTSYELRRYAGSRLLDKGASMLEVRDFFRHRDITTTQQWYAYRLSNRSLPTIGLSELVPRSAVA
jgi:hypothetical protein